MRWCKKCREVYHQGKHCPKCVDNRPLFVEENDLIDQYGAWGEHEKYPRQDWVYEVVNGDTNNGYWHWVANRIMNDD